MLPRDLGPQAPISFHVGEPLFEVEFDPGPQKPTKDLVKQLRDEDFPVLLSTDRVLGPALGGLDNLRKCERSHVSTS